MSDKEPMSDKKRRIIVSLIVIAIVGIVSWILSPGINLPPIQRAQALILEADRLIEKAVVILEEEGFTLTEFYAAREAGPQAPEESGLVDPSLPVGEP